MSLHRKFDDSYFFSDFSMDEDVEELAHRKYIKKRLEDKLEQRRLKEELDELDSEFDWDEFTR